jgi:nucleoside-diphosphate-sugar epimerase
VKHLLPIDLNFMLDRLESDFRARSGAHWFITGATGLLGKWFLEVLLESNKRFNTHFRVTALSRDPKRFATTMPHLEKNSALHWICGDAASFAYPNEPIDHMIHAAAEIQNSKADLPSKFVKQQLEATEHFIEFCRQNPKAKVLFTSSGAVYGQIPSGMTHVPESYLGAPDVSKPTAAYGEAKRISELLFHSARLEFNLDFKISRTFAVVGAHLPLESHFAIGNFIGQGMQHKSIQISGDGTATRSYLHMAEHTTWLFKILFHGTVARAYNVGSDDSRSILEVAKAVSAEFAGSKVEVTKIPQENQAISRYVPSIEQIKKELGLQVEIPLQNAIQRTIQWWQTQ